MPQSDRKIWYNFLPGTLLAILLFLVFLLSNWLNVDLGPLGLYPRTVRGLIGAFTAPFLHEELTHLLSNCFPLLLLSGTLIMAYGRFSLRITAWLYLFTSLLSWLIARPAYHIGASGIVYGLASFLFFAGLLGKQRATVAISVSIMFLYSGMIYGLFPTEDRVSWESHLAGAIVGMLLAFWYRKVPSLLQDERTTLEEEEDTKPNIKIVREKRNVTSSDGTELRSYRYVYLEKPTPPTEHPKNEKGADPPEKSGSAPSAT